MNETKDQEQARSELTLHDIIEMEERGFKIPQIIKLQCKLPAHNDGNAQLNTMVRGMLTFAIDREYYAKAAILRDFLYNKSIGDDNERD